MSTTPHDPIKALREEIQGLSDVKNTLLHRERSLVKAYSELEVELTTVQKLRGFADAELDRKRAVLRELENANA